MKLKKSVKFREEKFGGVLFETLSEKVYSLNLTGAAVAKAVSQGGSEPEIMERLKSSFEDASGSMEAQARSFLSQLRNLNLVEE